MISRTDPVIPRITQKGKMEEGRGKKEDVRGKREDDGHTDFTDNTDFFEHE